MIKTTDRVPTPAPAGRLHGQGPSLPRRFHLREAGAGAFDCIDRLRVDHQVRLEAAAVDASAGAGHAHAEILRRGFMQAALPPALRAIADRPRVVGDQLFWQYPARTEASAFDVHAPLAEAPRDGNAVHTYLGLPWATWIDQRNHPASEHRGRDAQDVGRELMMQRVRIVGLRRALQDCGVQLRVHTVCQHVAWQTWLPDWRRLGITDLWLSHAPSSGVPADACGPALHAWPLLAVNVEDPERRAGLQFGRDPATKPLLASFVGAHMEHYLSDVRLRLRALADAPRFHVHVTDKWHFEDLVYQHQIGGRPREAGGSVADTVQSYNRVLSDSVFALCPAGAGPNTLRLWEALAVGSVPVILGPAPLLPRGGTLPDIDWDDIVLRVDDHQIPNLPATLAAMPMDEVRRRQGLAMRAFAQVRALRCF